MGTWGHHQDDGLALRLRAVYHLVWATRQGQDLDIRHVPGHTGNYGNELVDILAKSIRKHDIEPRVPTLNMSHWFHGTYPNILWAWLPFDTDRRCEDTLQYSMDKLCWTSLDAPNYGLDWLADSQPDVDDTLYVSLQLRLGSYNAGSIKEAGRTALLREQAQYYGFHALGLQETRTTPDDPNTSNYLRIVSAAESGVGGCELWLSQTLPYYIQGQQKGFFRRENLQVVYATSQILMAVYQDEALHLLFCVAHAPHSGQAPKTVQAWWQQLTTQVQRYIKRYQLVLMIDANADPPTHLPHVGSLRPQERERLRPGDRAFDSFLVQFGLTAPSTHEELHYGEQITWMSNDGMKTARTDYIAIPTTWMDMTLSSSVCQHMDSGVDGFDHFAVQLDVTGILCAQQQHHKQIHYDRTKIMKATEEEGQQFFSDLLRIPWNVDVTTHAHLLEKHLHSQMAQLFPASRSRRRSTTFTDATWELFGERNKLKKILNSHPLAHSQLLGYCAFWAWQRGEELRPIQHRLIAYILKMSFTWCKLRDCGKRLKDSIRTDRAGYVDSVMDTIDLNSKKSILQNLKPLKLGKRVANLGRKPMPIVLLENGEVASTPQQARDRWRDHYAKMEGGRETTAAELLRRQPLCDKTFDISLDDLPSIFEMS